ncbi:hypothetical protein [Streptomyces sp. NBC_00059]|uniref:hypothetical protein n=1 Tax=Streptomyces sp. NBC_00059 TaxID=2975635 RepID=UPI0022594C48|nr:hypothetical protein [Streptomyces sp. NBC_00059]MCX5413459.1 hypothetical protein [Streptomyces sp. NBC_00059]
MQFHGNDQPGRKDETAGFAAEKPLPSADALPSSTRRTQGDVDLLREHNGPATVILMSTPLETVDE